MILFRDLDKKKYKERPKRIIDMTIDEKPERPVYTFHTNKERYKYCTKIKLMVRRSPEYRRYVKFLKKHMGMDKCDVFRNLKRDDEESSRKRYTIELHHTPFTLMEIINTVVSKRQAMGETLNPYYVVEEVLGLHYDGKVGLINLSKTPHECAENGRIFIPLQRIYHHGYVEFVNEYEEYMDDNLKAKIEMILQMSLKCEDIVSDCMDPEFVYINIDGFEFPEVPEKWKECLDNVAIEKTLEDK